MRGNALDDEDEPRVALSDSGARTLTTITRGRASRARYARTAQADVTQTERRDGGVRGGAPRGIVAIFRRPVNCVIDAAGAGVVALAPRCLHPRAERSRVAVERRHTRSQQFHGCPDGVGARGAPRAIIESKTVSLVSRG